jgi:GH24 family phage-related lysozyme (muramidase)
MARPNLAPDEQLIVTHEGWRNTVYRDTRDIPSIGVGYNLLNASAKTDLASVGADYGAIVAGASMTDDQVYALFQLSFARATSAARFCVSTFDQQPQPVQSVLRDMAFNLGQGGLKAFHNMILAINANDYVGAIEEMQNSVWARQLPVRSAHDIGIIQSCIPPAEATS